MNLERWRQIDHVFQLAVDLDGDERERFLGVACGMDSELREEVESLIEHERGSVELSRELELTVGPRLRVAPGDRLGSWRLGAVIGEGGSSIVFEAEREDVPFEQRLAIKVLKSPLFTQRALERFHVECRVLARLDHPNITRLYDAGTTGAGLPFIVLERVAGSRLDAWCAESRPSLDERLRLFHKTCDAVAFAHGRLVVHRDLKPGNVLVTASGEPKLLDFGIARILPEEGLEGTRLTLTQLQPMTPQYASPEQLRGDDVTTASDVYSLGLLLYELLAGCLPYTLERGSREEARRLLEASAFKPPSALAAGEDGESGSGVSPAALRGDLDTIAMTAVARDPAERYASAAALGEEVDRFRRGLPIQARSPSTLYVLRRFVGRHRRAVATVVAFLLLTLVFAAFQMRGVHRLRLEEGRARAEATTAREVVAFLGGLFEGAEPAVHQGRELTARQLLDRGARAFEQRMASEPETRGALAAAIGKAYLELSVLPEARRFLELSLAERAEAASPGALAGTHRLMARLELAESAYGPAAAHAEKAAELSFRLGQSLGEAEALILLASARIAGGDLDAGTSVLDRALNLLGEDPERYPALAGAIHGELGGVLLARGRFLEARVEIERALDLLTTVHGRLHPRIFELRRMRAFLLGSLGEEGKVPTELLELLEDQRQLFGEAHEQMVWTLTDLASQYVVWGEDDVAERYYREASAMREKLLADGHVLVAVIEAGLGHILWRDGRQQEAIASFERSLAAAERLFEPGSVDLAYPKMFLGNALRATGRCAEAVPLLADAVKIFGAQRREGDFAGTEAQWSYGYGLWCLGEERGLRLMREAVARADRRQWNERGDLSRQVASWREEVEKIERERR